MKKLIIFLGLLLFSFSNSDAQDLGSTGSFPKNAIGLRFGSYGTFGGGITYQRKISDATRAEFNFAYRSQQYYTGMNINAIYQKVLDFEPVDNMNWYLGVGGGLGTWSYKDNYYVDTDSYTNNGIYFSIIGQAGVEYIFDEIPLLISLDLGPVFNIGDFDSGLYIGGGLSVRYTF